MNSKITALQVQKHNPQRVNVYLDDEFAFGLARITAAWLYVGQELTEEKIAALQAEDTGEAAYQRALKFLDYRARTSAEVRRKLTEHEVPAEVIAEVVERLQRSGLLDDARFAQSWVESRSEFRPRSRKALSLELRQRGLEPEAISQAVETLDDEAMAYQAALKQARRLQTADWQDFRRKLSGFLARRGFDYAVISTVVRRIWDENRTAMSEE